MNLLYPPHMVIYFKLGEHFKFAGILFKSQSSVKWTHLNELQEKWTGGLRRVWYISLILSVFQCNLQAVIFFFWFCAAASDLILAQWPTCKPCAYAGFISRFYSKCKTAIHQTFLIFHNNKIQLLKNDIFSLHFFCKTRQMVNKNYSFFVLW